MAHHGKKMTAKEQKRYLEMEKFKRLRGVDRVERLPIKLLSVFAQAPTYGSYDAAGLDLAADLSLHTTGLTALVKRKQHSADHPDKFMVRIYPGERVLVHTGVSMAVPPGHYGRVAPRSGLAMKSGIDVLAGVIDSDYRGEVGVILINHGGAPIEIKHGDRIAQLIIEKSASVIVEEISELPPSKRGEGGFGSTGT